MGSVLLKLAVSYLEAHPDQVVALIQTGVDALIAHLQTKKAAA